MIILSSSFARQASLGAASLSGCLASVIPVDVNHFADRIGEYVM